MSWNSVILSLQDTTENIMSSNLKINTKNKISKLKSKSKNKNGNLDIGDDQLPLNLLFEISKQLTKSIEEVEILLKEKDFSFNSNSLTTDETINDLIPIKRKYVKGKNGDGYESSNVKLSNYGDKNHPVEIDSNNGILGSRNSSSSETNTKISVNGSNLQRLSSLDNKNSTNSVGSDVESDTTLKSGNSNTKSNSLNSSNLSNSSEKLITIGAKYGYPAPPPLSTYNGKIGRSFYTSAYNPSTPILPNSQIAYCPSNGRDNNFSTMHSEWILCRVLRVISETRFEIQDPEPDDLHPQGQIFRANYKEVILVPLHLVSASISKLKEYKPGTRVLAKYPETTTFYPAEVMISKNGNCMLRFEGEEEVGKLTSVDRVFVLPCPK